MNVQETKQYKDSILSKKKEEMLMEQNHSLQELEELATKHAQHLENLLLKKALGISNENYTALQKQLSAGLDQLRTRQSMLDKSIEKLQSSNNALAADFNSAIDRTIAQSIMPSLNTCCQRMAAVADKASAHIDKVKKESDSFNHDNQNITLFFYILAALSTVASAVTTWKIMHM